MSWFTKRAHTPRPELGDYRIVEVTLNNGKVSWTVEQFGLTYDGAMAWGDGQDFKSLENAKRYVNDAMGNTVASRKVVWP